MKIVFLGASSFGLRCLNEIINIRGCEVVGVVTSPQNFKISYNPKGVKNYLHENFKPFCSNNNIPLLEIKDGMKDKELFGRVAALEPQIFIVVGWYHMVPKKWRELSPAYGMHASLLPRYSGGAPLVWSIINDEKQAGISLFALSDGVDDGAILGQYNTPILYEDDISTLYKRIEDLGLKLLLENLPKLINGNADFTDQNENLRTLYPQRSPEDGLINWNKSSREIYNFIRAQTEPYPGAFSFVNDEKIILWNCLESVDPKINNDLLNGSLYKREGKVLVKTADGLVSMSLIECDSKKISGHEIFKFFKDYDHFDSPKINVNLRI